MERENSVIPAADKSLGELAERTLKTFCEVSPNPKLPLPKARDPGQVLTAVVRSAHSMLFKEKLDSPT